MADQRVSTSLSSVLRNEGQQIEALSYALWSLGRLTSADNPDLTPQDQITARRDVERTVAQLRQLELTRALLASQLASEVRCHEDISLTELAQALGDPWRAPLLIHRAALSDAIIEVDALAANMTTITTTKTPNGLANHMVSQAVPRSLVWFLRTPLG